MTIFSKLNGFFSRHRNKFIVGGIIITGSVLLTRYAQQRLKEWQERETKEFLERNRKQNHFESISRTCNQTIINLTAALFEAVCTSLNTDEIIDDLKNNPNNKVENWNNLKSLVFAKSCLIIYSTVMLVVTLKIQLSIIGDPNSVPNDMQEKYLSHCQSFLNLGVPKLAAIMLNEVKKTMEPIDLKKQMKLSDIEALYWAIQSALATNNENPVDQFRKYIFHDHIPDENNIYNDILRDTADFLDSEEVKSLTTHCINRAFILLGDQVAEFYTQNGSKLPPAVTNVASDFLNPFDVKKPLAKLIPITNGLLSKPSFPQHLVQQLITNEKIQNLSANVYESLL
ncbi:hypothetical protein NQ317_004891 [Molorchus minor]|uniref:Peroxisomal biogenesis factor 3 n=1 Tax=Molorchus minor TaxID=1323400 RepID=A0ABQ9IZC4_9CUCU|nr:hypothetical protein NQ317_004891 [Molorchus minor]